MNYDQNVSRFFKQVEVGTYVSAHDGRTEKIRLPVRKNGEKIYVKLRLTRSSRTGENEPGRKIEFIALENSERRVESSTVAPVLVHCCTPKGQSSEGRDGKRKRGNPVEGLSV
jgi:hypothetical protein